MTVAANRKSKNGAKRVHKPQGPPGAETLTLASPGAFYGIEVTPAIADEWLGLNSKNRNPTTGRVRRHVRLMKEGKWRDNASTISFSEEGHLLDGQHRLMAVFRSGRPQRFIVATGVPVASFETMDTGKSRTAADVLSIEGYPNPRDLAALARAVTDYDAKPGYGTADEGVSMTNAEVREWVAEHAQAKDSVAKGKKFFNASDKSMRKTVLQAAHYIVAREASVKEADEFTEQLATGVGITSSDDPVHRLRVFVADNSNRSRRNGYARLTSQELLGLVALAYNRRRQGRSLGQFRRDGKILAERLEAN